MSFVQILWLAVGLAMDATAVAAARGCTGPVSVEDVLRIALSFGAAQALMPVLGWMFGVSVGHWVAAFDHWIAFVVLAALGAKMLHDAFRDEQLAAPARLGWRVLLGLALATSVDAFAVGLTLPLLHAPFALSIATIGLVTAVLSGCGVVAGRHFGAVLGRRLDVFGGLVLILLGCKILVEHLLASA
jgi:putative Mn2+ efflux pump MntP